MSLVNVKLRHKLTLVTMLTSVAALVLACGAFLGYELLTFERTMNRDLAILGDVIGDNSTAALTFGDNEAAGGVLARRISWATVWVGRAPFASQACSFSVLMTTLAGFWFGS